MAAIGGLNDFRPTSAICFDDEGKRAFDGMSERSIDLSLFIGKIIELQVEIQDLGQTSEIVPKTSIRKEIRG